MNWALKVSLRHLEATGHWWQNQAWAAAPVFPPEPGTQTWAGIYFVNTKSDVSPLCAFTIDVYSWHPHKPSLPHDPRGNCSQTALGCTNSGLRTPQELACIHPSLLDPVTLYMLQICKGDNAGCGKLWIRSQETRGPTLLWPQGAVSLGGPSLQKARALSSARGRRRPQDLKGLLVSWEEILSLEVWAMNVSLVFPLWVSDLDSGWVSEQNGKRNSVPHSLDTQRVTWTNSNDISSEHVRHKGSHHRHPPPCRQHQIRTRKIPGWFQCALKLEHQSHISAVSLAHEEWGSHTDLKDTIVIVTDRPSSSALPTKWDNTYKSPGKTAQDRTKQEAEL